MGRIAGAVFMVMALGAVSVTPAIAGAPDFASDTLTGNWGGARTHLYDRGVNLNLYYTGDFAANLTGGDKKTVAYASGIDFVGAFDFEKLVGWTGGSFHIEIANFNGTLLDAKANLGSLLGTEQIFVGHATYLANFYLEQSLWSGLVDLKYGRMDFNTNFYPTLANTQFQGLSFFGPQPGLVAVDLSDWPASSMGGAVTVTPSKIWNFTVASYAVQPNNNFVPSQGMKPWNRGHRIGNVTVAQVELTPTLHRQNPGGSPTELGGTWAFGGWHNSAPQSDLFLAEDGMPQAASSAEPLIRHSADGFYVTGQQQVTQNGAGGGLTVFANFVSADSDVDYIDQMSSVGVTWAAPFKARPSDAIGFVVARNRVSDRAADLARAINAESPGAPVPVPGSEYLSEINYLFQLPRGVSVMPNLQFVHHPGGESENSDYLVFGVQLNASL